MEQLPGILLLLASYLIGSIPAAVWISKYVYGADVRTFGSGNAGSTNMFRTFGFKAGIATQVIDILKGVAAALLGHFYLHWFAEKGILFGHFYPPLDAMLCGLAAVTGHIFPVLAGFRGGKGINTLLGMMIVVYPLGAAVSLGVFLLTLFTTKMVSMGSMLGTLAFPVFALLMKFPYGVTDWHIALFGFFFFALVVFTHRTNVKRILAGNENKISLGRKK